MKITVPQLTMMVWKNDKKVPHSPGRCGKIKNVPQLTRTVWKNENEKKSFTFTRTVWINENNCSTINHDGVEKMIKKFHIHQDGVEK